MLACRTAMVNIRARTHPLRPSIDFIIIIWLAFSSHILWSRFSLNATHDPTCCLLHHHQPHHPSLPTAQPVNKVRFSARRIYVMWSMHTDLHIHGSNGERSSTSIAVFVFLFFFYFWRIPLKSLSSHTNETYSRGRERETGDVFIWFDRYLTNASDCKGSNRIKYFCSTEYTWGLLLYFFIYLYIFAPICSIDSSSVQFHSK